MFLVSDFRCSIWTVLCVKTWSLLRCGLTSSRCSVCGRTSSACTGGISSSSSSFYWSYFSCKLLYIFPPHPRLRPPRAPRLLRADWDWLAGRRVGSKRARPFGCSRQAGLAAAEPHRAGGLPGPAAHTGQRWCWTARQIGGWRICRTRRRSVQGSTSDRGAWAAPEEDLLLFTVITLKERTSYKWV